MQEEQRPKKFIRISGDSEDFFRNHKDEVEAIVATSNSTLMSVEVFKKRQEFYQLVDSVLKLNEKISNDQTIIAVWIKTLVKKRGISFSSAFGLIMNLMQFTKRIIQNEFNELDDYNYLCDTKEVVKNLIDC